MKKAEVTTSQLKAIIFMIASFVVLVALIAQFGLNLQKSADTTTCRASVKAHTSGQFKDIGFVADELKCPTQYPVIKARTEEEIKYAIADEMKRCWDDFGRGRLELFDDEAIFCSVCSVMEFQKKGVVIEDFTEWLSETEIPELARNGTYLSYMDYFANYESMEAGGVIDEARQEVADKNQGQLSPDLSTDELYSVVFVYIKGKHWIAEYKKTTGSRLTSSLVAGGGMGIAAGGATVVALSLVPGVNLGVWTLLGLGSTIGLTTGTVTTWEAFFAKETPDVISMVLLKKHNETELLDLACERYPSLQKS